MEYSDEQIDALLDKMEQVGLISALSNLRTFSPQLEREHREAYRKAMREALSVLN